MRLRPRHALTTAVTAAVTVALAVLPAFTATATAKAAAAGAADRHPTCGKASGHDFPIETRIHGGPASYRPGDDAGTWYLDLTNTTDRPCGDIHPVVVLVDRDRTLGNPQVTLETRDDHKRWRMLSLEKSDQDEIIGVLDDGSPGFDVPAGRTVTVHARLAFAADTSPNEVVMTAAAVQRRGDDGEWVGESDDYRFAVGEAGADDAAAWAGEQRRGREPERGSEPERESDSGRESAGAKSSAGAPGNLGAPGDPHTSGNHNASSTPGPHRSGGQHELAGTRTGADGDPLGHLVSAVAMLVAGAILFAGIRRLRTVRA